MIYHIHTTYYNAAIIPQLALYTHNVTEHTHTGVCNTFCKDIWLIPQLNSVINLWNMKIIYIPVYEPNLMMIWR